MKLDIEKIKFDANGLVPAIVQEESGQVLMLAYMNAESLAKTAETGYAHFTAAAARRFGRRARPAATFSSSRKFITTATATRFW